MIIFGNSLDSKNKRTICFKKSVSTGPHTPQSIVLLTTMVKDVMGLLVSWDPAQGASQYMAMSSSGLNCSSTSTSCTLSPLNCGQIHYISVPAFNRAGPSQFFEPQRYVSCEFFWICIFLVFISIVPHFLSKSPCE